LFRCNSQDHEAFTDGTIQFLEYPIRNQLLTSLFCDRWNVLWVGTSGRGLYFGDLDSDSFGVIASREEGGLLDSGFVRAILLDRESVLWVGTSGGLNLVNRSTGETRTLTNIPRRPQSLKDYEIRSLAQDNAGNIWVGTTGSGLHCFNPRNGDWRSYQHDPGDPGSLSGDWVETILPDRQGRLWIGVGMYGLDLLESGSEKFQHFNHVEFEPSSLPSNRVTTVYQTSVIACG
jgi:ligand-binding sensor domain-containing protein